MLYAKDKYRGVFEIQKSGDKTSSGEIGLDIRTHASPKVGQDQVSGGVSVLCWHAAPVAYVSLAWISSVIVLISLTNCLKTYRYQCLMRFPYPKLNSSRNGQYILLLCHDNPSKVSSIARFCTNFTLGGPRPPTNHIGF